MIKWLNRYGITKIQKGFQWGSKDPKINIYPIESMITFKTINIQTTNKMIINRLILTSLKPIIFQM